MDFKYHIYNVSIVMSSYGFVFIREMSIYTQTEAFVRLVLHTQNNFLWEKTFYFHRENEAAVSGIRIQSKSHHRDQGRQGNLIVADFLNNCS